MKEIIDLTYNIENDMTSFSANWHPKISIMQVGSIETVGRETRKVVLGTHTGTHMDAPLHFINGGASIDQASLNTLIGPVTIINLSHLGVNGVVTIDMLKEITITQRILFIFGWGKHWKTDNYYKNYPYFSKDTAEYLIQKGVELVAMDTPSPDDSHIRLSGEILGSEKDSPVHKCFLSNNVMLVEYLANVESISDYHGCNIIVMPLKLKGADGASARVCIFK